MALQLGGPDEGGVDHMRLFTQVGQQLAFEFDRLHQGALLRASLRQRVAASGL